MVARSIDIFIIFHKFELILFWWLVMQIYIGVYTCCYLFFLFKTLPVLFFLVKIVHKLNCLLEMCIKSEFQVCKCMCMCTVVCCLYIWWNPHIRGAYWTVILPKTKILCTFFVQFHFVCFVSHISVFVHLFVCFCFFFVYNPIGLLSNEIPKTKNIVFNMHILGRSALRWCWRWKTNMLLQFRRAILIQYWFLFFVVVVSYVFISSFRNICFDVIRCCSLSGLAVLLCDLLYIFLPPFPLICPVIIYLALIYVFPNISIHFGRYIVLFLRIDCFFYHVKFTLKITYQQNLIVLLINLILT